MKDASTYPVLKSDYPGKYSAEVGMAQGFVRFEGSVEDITAAGDYRMG